MSKVMKKTVTILLAISLVYANLAGTIFGIISYAQDNQNPETVDIDNTNVVEEEKALKMETSELFKNNMQEEKTEYQEKLELNLNYENTFNEIKISDVNTEISDGVRKEILTTDEAEETISDEKIDIYYKTTRINKQELINAIGSNGKLEVRYSPIEENKEDVAVLPEESETINQEEDAIGSTEEAETEEQNGIIMAEKGIVEIEKDTEADEEGYITIVYPEKTSSLKIELLAEINKIEKLEIVHTKIIEKVANIEKVKLLETTKKIVVKGEEELLNKQESLSMPINYTKTVAELGIDKSQISTSVENKVNFTITMYSNELKYDLYKKPYFVIELPKEIKTINIDNTLILNNTCFEVASIGTGTLENGNKGIAIKLNGEQTEHTKSNEENIQIVLEATITTNELMPSIESMATLHYKNENAKTYDGIGMQDSGTSSVDITLVSNKEIIVETKAKVGEEITSSFKENYSTINVAPNTYNMATIQGTVINNTGESIENAKILGTVKNIGPISGVQNVYYTESENATPDINDAKNGWTSEYMQTAKKYLIVIENFEQGQTVTFGYYMYMPETVEDDTRYELSYDVYSANNEVLKTSKITIYQEAERFDYYEDEKIKANIVLENSAALEIGEYAKYKINILNTSDYDLEDISLKISVPEIIEETYTKVSVNGQNIKADILNNEKEIEVIKLDIKKGEVITIEVSGKVANYTKQSETVKVNINYEQKQAELSSKMKIVEPSVIETSITSNKLNQTLQENEEIQYKVVLKNNGESHAEVDINLPELTGICIRKIQSTNITTGQTKSITSGNLIGSMQRISINPGEIVEIYIDAAVKSLKKDMTETMYVDITGETIYDTTTNKLVNKINKKTEEEIEQEIQLNSEEVKTSTIEGIAWIDQNQNGRKDEKEVLLKGVQAVLINTETSKEVATKTTDNNGEYIFNDIPQGNYVVAFQYNTSTLHITDYKNENVEEELDSDVINTTQDNKTIAKTEVLLLEKGKTESVNAGFVINQKFDMSINKGITKVTVNNEQGTSTYGFNNTNMAKVEIDGEYLKGSLILVEYEIAVTNAGEVAGFAKKISDKIPEGMKFNSELNTNWYEGNDGILYCEELSNKELLPGETAIVKLILTKEMTDDKVISPINTVTLEETFNEYLIEDKKQENNSAEATIIISLTTGKVESYIWLILLVIAIIGTGAFSVIKITNKDYSKITDKERRK